MVTIVLFAAALPAQAPTAQLHGYLDARVAKEIARPAGVESGATVYESTPHAFDVPSLSLMSELSYGRFRGSFGLLSESGDGVGVSSAWLEASLVGELLLVRAGKLYRPWGLYNEILEEVPSYIGIEAPEMFDEEHLLLSRTTNFMLHGRWESGEHRVAYALTTGNDERAGGEVPLGGDLRYSWRGMATLGTSYYSTMGDAAPGQEGGVLPWMSRDDYQAYGGYLEVKWEGVLVQAEYWQALHDAERDPAKVVALADTVLNERQARRFGIDPADPDRADVATDAHYVVTTWYARLGYTLDTELVGQVVPYLRYDAYRNPEMIRDAAFGGDEQAGLADDGRFSALTLGVLVRPFESLALKVEASDHAREFNGAMEQNAVFRASLSYGWAL
jgi:hypothetical protein